MGVQAKLAVGSVDDRVFVMDNIKSGRDIQMVSLYYTEQEVLFAPGSRFKVTGVGRTTTT